MGVEEELVLIDPESRRPTSRSGAAQEANESSAEVGPELFRHQVESSTPPLQDAVELEQARFKATVGQRWAELVYDGQ